MLELLLICIFFFFFAGKLTVKFYWLLRKWINWNRNQPTKQTQTCN